MTKKERRKHFKYNRSRWQITSLNQHIITHLRMCEKRENKASLNRFFVVLCFQLNEKNQIKNLIP